MCANDQMKKLQNCYWFCIHKWPYGQSICSASVRHVALAIQTQHNRHIMGKCQTGGQKYLSTVVNNHIYVYEGINMNSVHMCGWNHANATVHD